MSEPIKLDIFRKEYKPLSIEQKQWLDDIKDRAEYLYNCINKGNIASDPRMLAIANTNLEQAIMWAIKAIT